MTDWTPEAIEAAHCAMFREPYDGTTAALIGAGLDAAAAAQGIKDEENARLREENSRLREALKPFAGILKGNYSHQSDDMPIKAGANQYDLVFVFTLGDLRAAAAAIREGGKIKAEAVCPKPDEAP